MEVDLILKKKDCKQNLIGSNSSNSGKVILTLLRKVITLQIEPMTRDVKKLGFKLIPK